MFGAADLGVGRSARQTPRYWERAGKESNVGEFVSIGAPLSQHDTATRSGDCLRVWRIDGVAFESAEFNLIKDRHDAWCNVLRNLSAGRKTRCAGPSGTRPRPAPSATPACPGARACRLRGAAAAIRTDKPGSCAFASHVSESSMQMTLGPACGSVNSDWPPAR